MDFRGHTVHKGNEVGKVHSSHQREVTDICIQQHLLLVGRFLTVSRAQLITAKEPQLTRRARPSAVFRNISVGAARHGVAPSGHSAGGGKVRKKLKREADQENVLLFKQNL